MKLVSFAVPYTQDKRMIYAAEYLEKHGFKYTEDTENCDFVLLPVPVKKEMIDSVKGKIVFYGKGDYKNGFDYMKNETYVQKKRISYCGGRCCLLGAEYGLFAYRKQNTAHRIRQNRKGTP